MNGTITDSRRQAFASLLELLQRSGYDLRLVPDDQAFLRPHFSTSIWTGSFCDINAFFNCDSSAFSALSAIRGVPLGYYVFAIVSFVLYWRYGVDRDQTGILSRWFRPAALHAVTYAVLTLAGAYGFAQFYEAKREAQSGGVAARIVDQFFGLPVVALPTVISPFMTAQATESFTDAPIQIIEYADLLCSEAAKDSARRVELARRHGVEAALTDSATRALVHSIIDTGMEHRKTSAEYEHGMFYSDDDHQ